jgi:hypothetical protein
MDFREALSELYQGKMFPLRSYDIQLELEKDPLRRWPMKKKVSFPSGFLLSFFNYGCSFHVSNSLHNSFLLCCFSV